METYERIGDKIKIITTGDRLVDIESLEREKADCLIKIEEFNKEIIRLDNIIKTKG